MFPFYNPWEHKIFWCFQGVQKGSIGLKTEDDEAENATFPAVTSINV